MNNRQQILVRFLVLFHKPLHFNQPFQIYDCCGAPRSAFAMPVDEMLSEPSASKIFAETAKRKGQQRKLRNAVNSEK